MEKQTYHVTAAGGPVPDIGGKRRRPGDIIELNDAEAEYELLRGVIISDADVKKAEAAAEKAAKKAAKAD